MKYKCDMIRDLMSLCADGIASASSQEAVKEHLAECKACAEEWNQVQKKLPHPPQEPMPEEMKKSHKIIKRLRRHRIVTSVIMLGIGVLVGWFVVFPIYDEGLRLTAKQAAMDAYDFRKTDGSLHIIDETAMPESNKHCYWLTNDNGKLYTIVVKRSLFWSVEEAASWQYRVSNAPIDGLYFFAYGSSGIPDRMLIACFAEDKSVQSITLNAYGETKTQGTNENGLAVFEYPWTENSHPGIISGNASNADGTINYILRFEDGRGYYWTENEP